ncbi:Gfo/Idh/MocA family protein [Pleomorphomonas sp. JP5]|uniref:Gfo/Idh/MocA family protein n=1 Tax=Pleomorphomonas sp. JP5 TaxID=2942998 RepID=UPI0020437963|nr:Gfo/Idh/MocA family oxidoreductase [Pleomorphomonas sp. JP5]MCM5557281.1 Gfo/Idh/MocA family oxidoreductase [Pleomorphomonas sp. JP5]
MAVRFGLVGCGIMGADHARILRSDIAGAELVAVHDKDRGRAERVAADGCKIHADPGQLIADPAVDAVIIASPDATHAPLTRAAIALGKPVLCEKPMATSLDEARGIVDAEVAGGRQLVQVGFMRRFDPGYRAMRAAVTAGTLGNPLFLHCIHRNAVGPDYVTSDLVLANSCVHEIDISRFVLGEDHARVRVVRARPSRKAPNRQPLMMILETASGVVVSVEAFLDAQYGYDVQGELVCEEGTLSLDPHPPTRRRLTGLDGHAVEGDWVGRFAEAYRCQLRDFVVALNGGRFQGSSAWDGYVASLTAEAALKALKSGDTVPVTPGDRPAFYDAAG